MSGIGRSNDVDFWRDAATHDAAIIPRQNAGDRIQMPVQVKSTADNMGIAAQPPTPETVAEYSDGAGPRHLRIEPANRRANAEDLEKISARHHLPDDFAVRAGNPVDIGEPEVESQILKHAGIAQFTIPAIWNVGGHARQPLGLPRADVVEDHLANDAVDGDVGAQAESQGKNTDGSESRGFAETPQSVVQIREERWHLSV